MISDRLLRRLTLFLLLLGAFVSIFGIVIEDHIQTMLGVIVMVFGILSYAYIRRIPVAELHYAKKPTPAMLVIQLSGTVITFAVTIYLTAVIGLVNLATLATFPSSWILMLIAIVFSAITTGSTYILVNSSNNVWAKILAKRLDLVVLIGVLVVVPKLTMFYSGTYILCLVGVYMYSQSLD